jgi:hypothetical protein
MQLPAIGLTARLLVTGWFSSPNRATDLHPRRKPTIAHWSSASLKRPIRSRMGSADYSDTPRNFRIVGAADFSDRTPSIGVMETACMNPSMSLAGILTVHLAPGAFKTIVAPPSLANTASLQLSSRRVTHAPERTRSRSTTASLQSLDTPVTITTCSWRRDESNSRPTT